MRCGDLPMAALYRRTCRMGGDVGVRIMGLRDLAAEPRHVGASCIGSEALVVGGGNGCADPGADPMVSVGRPCAFPRADPWCRMTLRRCLCGRAAGRIEHFESGQLRASMAGL